MRTQSWPWPINCGTGNKHGPEPDGNTPFACRPLFIDTHPPIVYIIVAAETDAGNKMLLEMGYP